jgi:hypothetical protein
MEMPRAHPDMMYPGWLGNRKASQQLYIHAETQDYRWQADGLDGQAWRHVTAARRSPVDRCASGAPGDSCISPESANRRLRTPSSPNLSPIAHPLGLINSF